MSLWANVELTAWSELPRWLRRQVGETLRDAFFALPRGDQTSDAARALLDAVNQVDEPAITRVDGLELSFHPTRRFKALRFIETAKLHEDVRRLFARPSPSQTRLAACFVDPQALSFSSFENVVTLDALFDELLLSLSVESLQPSSLGALSTFSLATDPRTHARLRELDGLGLYVPPFNRSQRGGQRFIFHAATLAEALTRALAPHAPRLDGARFVAVNPVFRCNRFEPHDAKFHEHHDTPYFDACRRHVSRFTLLLYLSGGTGTPTLSVEGVDVLTTVEPFTGVLLDQRYAHEGRPYADGPKIFLRTELLYEVDSLEHEPALAETFARATYLSGESLFTPELSKYADEAYELAATGHFEALRARTTPTPVLLKRFRGTPFATNGYDFFFSREVPLPEAASLALLDTFNAEVNGTPFRASCVTDTRTTTEDLRDWAPAWVLDETKRHRVEPALLPFTPDAFLPPVEKEACCCPTHHGDGFDATTSNELVEFLGHAQRFVRRRLESAPVVMLGQEIFLNAARFVLEGSRLWVLSRQALAPVNFAACWNSAGLSPPEFIGYDLSFTAMQPLTPPVLVGTVGGCWHLRFDFFRNGWLVKGVTESVPRPRVFDLRPEDEAERTDWFTEVGKLELPTVPPLRNPPFWSSGVRRLVEVVWQTP